MKALALFAALTAAAGSGCGPGASSPRPASSPAVTPGTSTSTPAASRAGAERKTIVFLGTSLTAGFGLDPSEAYPAVIQQKIDAASLPYRAVNAGVSGETSAGALRRIDWLLRQPVDVLVIETGANDGLRGQDPEATRENLRQLIAKARRREPPPRVVLVAMEALPNYGRDYGTRFRALYPELARETGAVLAPFLLDGVAGVASLNQPDGVHPTAAGQKRVADNLWKTLAPLLTSGTAEGHPARP
jgi:acyl-CoA thioesterase-1